MRVLLWWVQAILLVPVLAAGFLLVGLPIAAAVRGVIELGRWLAGP